MSVNQDSPAVLERIIRDNDLGWLIDMHASPRQAVPALLGNLDKVAAEYRTRIGVAVPFGPETLEAESRQNPHKIRAFLQALGISSSAEMLVMVWRILQGLAIRKVTMNYTEGKEFRLTVTLARTGENQEVLEEYESTDVHDAALIRHFGITIINGGPLFDGFYPLRQK